MKNSVPHTLHAHINCHSVYLCAGVIYHREESFPLKTLAKLPVFQYDYVITPFALEAADVCCSVYVCGDASAGHLLSIMF